MKTAIQVLISPKTKVSPERQRETMGLLGRQVDRLDRMVGDFLDASQIQAGKLRLHFREQDLREIIKDSIEIYRPISTRHRFELTLPSDPIELSFDSVRISQVLNNLLSNAVKYSPKGGKIFVQAESSDREVVIRVRDEGIGIRSEDVNRIFEPFSRPGASKDRIPGVGLGLSVAKKIVEQHGGQIDVESGLGKGTVFSVRLPFHRADMAA